MIYKVAIKYRQKGGKIHHKGYIAQTIQSDNSANAVNEVLKNLSKTTYNNIK